MSLALFLSFKLDPAALTLIDGHFVVQGDEARSVALALGAANRRAPGRWLSFRYWRIVIEGTVECHESLRDYFKSTVKMVRNFSLAIALHWQNNRVHA